MKVTIEDIARRVGKSVTTVSRALNDYPDVSPETKALIRRVADELGYSPSMLAQRLQKQRTDTIGLVEPTYEPRSVDPFFSEFIAGISKQATQAGFDLLVTTSLTGVNDINAYRDIAKSRRVDGFIIARTHADDARIRYLQEIGFPFVAFGRTSGELHFPFVDVDSYSGMRSVANHLVKLGWRSFAVISAPYELNFSAHRLQGIEDELDELGIRLNDEFMLTGDLSSASGYRMAKRLLQLPSPPDAIIACNDLMALGAMSAAQELGLQVGKNVAITGFDDIPLAEHANPPLTTVCQPIYEIGMQVCDMLVRTLRNEAFPDTQRIITPRLVIRESCGAKYSPRLKQ